MLEDLLGRYFDAGVAEGREGRTHDTADGLAQRTLCEIRAEVRRMVAVEREACAKLVEAGKIMQTRDEGTVVVDWDCSEEAADAIRARSNAE